MDAREVAAVFRPRGVADRRRGFVVELPDALCLRDRGIERDIRVTLLGRPDDRLIADDTRYPHARIGLLQGQGPGIDDAVLIVRSSPAEWTGHRPGLHDQVMRLLEALAVVCGVHAGRELLLAAAAHEPGHEPTLRDHVDHG